MSGVNSIDYYSNNSSGIYYHSDGYLYPSHSSWTVFISLDFSDLNEFFELGRFYLVYLNSTIGYYNFNYSSGITLQDVKLLEKNLGECKMKIDSLNNIFRTDNSRVKRSWLPFLGNMLHTVAGVATIKDVQHFQHAVKLLTDIQKDTLHSIEKETSVVNMTRLRARKNSLYISHIRKTLVKFVTDIDKVDRSLKQLSSDVQSLYISTHLNSLFLLSFELFDIINLEAEHYIGIIENAIDGKFPIGLLGVDYIRDILYKISGSIRSDQSLPFSITNEFAFYFSKLKSSLIVGDHSLGIRWELPIVQKDAFEIFRFYSFPVPHINGTGFQISLPYSIYAFSKRRSYYLALTNRVLENCGSFVFVRDILVWRCSKLIQR